MTTHLGIMVLYVALVSVVFGALLRAEPAEQIRLGSQIFVGMVVGAYVAGWILFAAFR